MKRAVKYGIITVLLVLTLISSISLGWLLGTPAGARHLLEVTARTGGLTFAAKKVEGRLWDGVRFTDIKLTKPDVVIQLDSVSSRWQPLSLLWGRFSITALDLQGVRVSDNTPKKAQPPDLSWPKVTGIPTWLDVRIGSLRIKDLVYRKAQESPVAIEGISGSLGWRNAVLTVQDLAVAVPALRLNGSLMAGFRKPYLLLAVVATPARPVASLDTLSVHAKLFAKKGPEQLVGPVSISGTAKGKQRLLVQGDLGTTRNVLNMRKVRLLLPGRRGAISGEGTISFPVGKPFVRAKLAVSGLDLSREIHAQSTVSGTLSLAGSQDSYQGRFSFINRGAAWREGRVTGSVQGNMDGIRITALDAVLLDGKVTGAGRIDWRTGVNVEADLQGRSLQPSRIKRDWNGLLNINLSGKAYWSKTQPLRAQLSGRLLESRLQGQALNGSVEAQLLRENIFINRLFLRGRGFALSAAGELNRKLSFAARVDDLSGLLPGSRGSLNAEGWLLRHQGRLSGSIKGTGRSLVMEGTKIAAMDFTAGVADAPGNPFRVSASCRGLSYGKLRSDDATVTAVGTLGRHTIDVALRSRDLDVRTALSGAYGSGAWIGQILTLSGYDAIGPWRLRAPVALRYAASRLSLGRLVLDGVAGEQLAVQGELAIREREASLLAEWQELHLDRANRWVSDVRLSGFSSGNLRWRWPGGDRLILTGRATASGSVVADSRRVNVKQASVQLDWGERGMLSEFDVSLVEGGSMHARLTSSLPSRMAVPSGGDFTANWQNFDVVLLRPWLPRNLDLTGFLAGQAKGKFLPGGRVELTGTAAVSRGEARWRNADGQYSATLRTADVSWVWREEKLSGNLSLALAEYGNAAGSFEAPLPARLPLAFNRRGPVLVSVTGQAREMGLLARLFPGLVQESSGKLDFSLHAAGAWENPQLTGELRLSEAGAYLPSAGARLKDVRLAAHLDQDKLLVDSFHVKSGQGDLQGSATLQFHDWRLARYQGNINGERFQVVSLPELQVLASPRLTFNGTPEKVTVRGDILVPELVVLGQSNRNAIQPSKDVVIEGTAPPAAKAPGILMDIQVGVVLGDKVMVKAEGIDAQLKGTVNLSINRLDEIRSTGEIRVVKGKYKTYGVNLDITRGRIYYAGGPIDQPTLDLRALRKVGDVKAGVTVVGTPHALVVKLYSEPAMPDSQILSYIVLGQPVASTREQSGLVSRAGSDLLSSTSPYRPLQGTAAASAKTTGSTLSQSMLTVGRYLTPDLYISYGRSLLRNSNLVRIRYSISRHWEVESQTGTESGGDIYYKVNFR